MVSPKVPPIVKTKEDIAANDRKWVIVDGVLKLPASFFRREKQQSKTSNPSLASVVLKDRTKISLLTYNKYDKEYRKSISSDIAKILSQADLKKLQNKAVQATGYIHNEMLPEYKIEALTGPVMLEITHIEKKSNKKIKIPDIFKK